MSRKIEKIDRYLQGIVPPEHVSGQHRQQLRWQILIEIESAQMGLEEWKQAHPEAVGMLTSQASRAPSASARPLNIRSIIMKSPIAKLVAAAVIVAVVLGIFELVGTDSSPGVVWAEVAKNVEASRGYTFRVTQTQTRADMEEPIKTCTIMYCSAEYGVKAESCPGAEPAVTTCVNRADGTVVSLIHPTKKYTRRSLPHEAVPGNAGEETGQMDPKAIVKQFVSGDYKELGRRTIEGVEAEGIEVDNPPGFRSNFAVDSHVAQLWVSVETGYPVMLESDIVGKNGDLRIEMVVDEFQWNVELDPSEFRVEIPADYTLMDMNQPQTTEKTGTITRKHTITRECTMQMDQQQTTEKTVTIRRKYQSSGDHTAEIPEP